MANPTREALIEAKRLLVERGWTTGVCARLASGESCRTDSPDAVAFCADGALWRATRGDDPAYCAASGLLNKACGFGRDGDANSFVGFNDAQTEVGPVLAMYDRAIELANAP